MIFIKAGDRLGRWAWPVTANFGNEISLFPEAETVFMAEPKPEGDSTIQNRLLARLRSSSLQDRLHGEPGQTRNGAALSRAGGACRTREWRRVQEPTGSGLWHPPEALPCLFSLKTISRAAKAMKMLDIVHY